VTRSPRAIVDGWLRSSGHRRNLFGERWRAQGIALVESTFQGEGGAGVWVSEFAG
jgi:uncharacterized protein YkwD